MDKKRSLVGLLYLAGAGLAASFLLLYGGWMLFAAVIATAIGNLASPDQPREDYGSIAIISAVMASAGLCLTVGLLTLGIRKIAGKPQPGWRSTKVFLAISSILIATTTLGAWRLTATDPVPAGYADLAGIWHRADDASQTCRFNSDGTIDYWSGGKARGKTGKWVRSGRTITILDDYDWRPGMISPNSITYAMPSTASGETPQDVKWVRDVKP